MNAPAKAARAARRAATQQAPARVPANQALAAAMALAGGYHGASRSRAALRNYNPATGDALDDTLYDLDTLRARSSDLVRNAPLAGGIIETTVTHAVGTGLTLHSRVDAHAVGLSQEDADAWQKTTEREWRLWCESTDCDATRTQDFYGLQSLAFRSALERGDVFAVLPQIRREHWPYSTAVQLIEADRCCNPQRTQDSERLVAGIGLDEYGAPLRYHFANRHPGAFRRGAAALEWTTVDARGANSGRVNVVHLFDRLRPGQPRGVPMLAPVIEQIKQLGRYTDAELQAAVVAGAFAIFVKMDPAAFADLFESEDLKSTYLDAAMRWDGRVNTSTLEGPGNAINLMPGEEVGTVNPGRPNDKFDPFVRAIVQQVGMRVGIPHEVLLKSFDSSYSAARAALLDAWRFFRGRREWLASMFCQPIYETWLAEAVALGRIRAPGFFADAMLRKAYAGAEWVGDGPGSIDPLKEVDAAGRRIELGISTIAAESILHDGGDWEMKHRQRVKEEDARRAAGLGAAPATQRVPDAPGA